MQMRRWRSFGAVLALAVGAQVALPVTARAQGDNGGIPPGARITKIGPQEAVIEYPDGHISKYDDPAMQARECDSVAACAGKALAAFGVFGAMVYEDLTTNVESSGAPAGPNGFVAPSRLE